MRASLPTPHTNIPIIKDRLVFSVLASQPKDTAKLFSFSVDLDEAFQYYPFFFDFGPPSLLHIHRFRILVNRLLSQRKELIQYYCSTDPQRIANAIMFISSYIMIENKCTPMEAYSQFTKFTKCLKPYRDASSFPSTYDLTVLSCLKGLYKGLQLGWYNPDTFDADDWNKYEQVENGDMNWIIPGKLMAFATPYSSNIIQGCFKVCTPREIAPVFKKKGITTIVRLCQKFYDEKIFKDAGFDHQEMYFLDGSVPPNDILKRFLNLAETNAVIAIHCKAGLGRTGTLCACYIIKNFGFDGDESIGWIRICRPGSIIGPQQKYVLKFAELFQRTKTEKSAPPTPTPPTPDKDDKTPQIHTPTKILREATSHHKTFDNVPPKPPPPPKHKSSGVSKRLFDPTSRTPKKPKQLSMEEELAQQVRSVSLTPKHPQPRKYNRGK